MSSVIRPVCDQCGVVAERKWTTDSLNEVTIYCKQCTNVFDVEVVDYPVDPPTINEQLLQEQEYKKGRAAWYAELYKPFVPGHA